MIFSAVFLLFRASVRSRPPGPPAVPGVFLKKLKLTPQKYFFLHISSSYAKILGEKLFRTWEFRRSGSKVKDGERKRKRERKKRLNNGYNNGQAMHGARKLPGPTF